MRRFSPLLMGQPVNSAFIFSLKALFQCRGIQGVQVIFRHHIANLLIFVKCKRVGGP